MATKWQRLGACLYNRSQALLRGDPLLQQTPDKRLRLRKRHGITRRWPSWTWACLRRGSVAASHAWRSRRPRPACVGRRRRACSQSGGRRPCQRKPGPRLSPQRRLAARAAETAYTPTIIHDYPRLVCPGDRSQRSTRARRRAETCQTITRERRLVELLRAPDLAPKRERLPELDPDLRPRLGTPARLQHHTQDAVDAEPGVPEAGVAVGHFPFGSRDDATLIVRRQRSSSTVQSFCFTFNHRLVRPLSYALASSLATRPS